MRVREPQLVSTFIKDVCSQTLGDSVWLVDLLAGGCAGELDKVAQPAAAAAAAKAAPVVDWRVKYGFKQPAPGVKSKSLSAHRADAPAAKMLSAGGSKGMKMPEQGFGDGGIRGGMSSEQGLGEMLAVLEGDVLVAEGRLHEGIAILEGALDKSLKEKEGSRGAARGGGDVCGEWVLAELRLQLGLKLLLAEVCFTDV